MVKLIILVTSKRAIIIWNGAKTRVVQHTVAEKARAAVHGEKRVVKIIYINLHNKPLNYNLRYDFNIFNLSCKYGVKYLENRPEA